MKRQLQPCSYSDADTHSTTFLQCAQKKSIYFIRSTACHQALVV